MAFESPKADGLDARSHSRARQAVGAGLVALSTVAIAIVPTFARFAFDGGSNTLSIITGRSLLSVLITFLLILALRQPLRIARRPLAISLVMGVDYAIMLYGYLGAVQYLPVSMVILIYFVHPLLVGFVVIGLAEDRLTLISLGALATALAGLSLAVGFSFERPDPTGLALAVLAMVTAAIVILGNARAMRQAAGLAVAFYMMVSAAATLVVLFAFFGTLALPATALGWTGYAGVAIASTAGTLTFICGMGYVGAARAAMISNLEPVLGVLFALAVLGERMTIVQGVGVAMVLAAIVAIEMSR